MKFVLKNKFSNYVNVQSGFDYYIIYNKAYFQILHEF